MIRKIYTNIEKEREALQEALQNFIERLDHEPIDCQKTLLDKKELDQVISTVSTRLRKKSPQIIILED